MILFQEEQQILVTETNIQQIICLWFKQSRKQKKLQKWNKFYYFIIKFLVPDIQFSQVLLDDQKEGFQQIKFLVSSSFTLIQQDLSNGYQIKSTDATLIITSGAQLVIYDKSEIKSIVKLQKLTLINQFFKSDAISLQRYVVYTKQNQQSILLKSDKKVLQKYKNDLIKLDRLCKEKFLSQYCFCGFYPHYSLKSLQLIRPKQKEEVKIKSDQIYIIYQGIIRMKLNILNKQQNCIDLNKGGYLQNSKFIQILNKFQSITDYSKNISFKTLTNCKLILIDISQFQKILYQSSKLKIQFFKQYTTLWNYRLNMINNIHTGIQYVQVQSQKKQNKIKFSLTKKGQNSKSFRVKNNLEQFQWENLMTVGIYDQIIKNKEKIALKKQQYQEKNFNSQRQTQSLNNNSRIQKNKKKIKQQIKNVKIRNFKIEKIALKLQIDNIQNLRKKMVFIKGIFQDYIPKRQKNQISQKNVQDLKKRRETRKGIRTKSLLPQFYKIKNRISLTNQIKQCQFTGNNCILQKQISSKKGSAKFTVQQLKLKDQSMPLKCILNNMHHSPNFMQRRDTHRKTARY